MIERLQRALEHIEELPPEAQEEVAEQIESLMPAIDEAGEEISGGTAQPRDVRVRRTLALAGAWSDIPWEEMERELDDIGRAEASILRT